MLSDDLFKKNFYNSQEGRSLKILNEYMLTKAKLAQYNIKNLIVQFGSARILPKAKAQEGLVFAQQNNKDVSLWTNRLEISQYYEDAKDLAFKFANWNKQISGDYYLCSGGGGGIMEATNLGALNAGAKNLGFNIVLPFEQDANPYITKELIFNFNYFFLRKFWFTYLARAFIVFPGGFGTLDELFENLTLIQTNKVVKKIPVVLFGKKFFDQLFNLESLVKYELISPEDLSHIFITDSIEDAFNYVINNITPYQAHNHV